MNKVMKPRGPGGGGSSQLSGYNQINFKMRSSESVVSHSRKNHVFNRSVSLSESEIQTHFGMSDSEEDKSDVIDEFVEDELIHSDFDDDEDDSFMGKDPFQRQLGYPPLPRYKTPHPANPLDKLGTLTPMEEMTEPPSSGANTPSWNTYGNTNNSNSNSKGDGGRSSEMSRTMSRNQSRGSNMKDGGDRSRSRSSMKNLTVDHGSIMGGMSSIGVGDSASRSGSRTGMNNLTVGARSPTTMNGMRTPSPSGSMRPDQSMSDFPISKSPNSRQASRNSNSFPDSSFGNNGGGGGGGRKSNINTPKKSRRPSPESMMTTASDATKKMNKSSRKNDGKGGIGGGGGGGGGGPGGETGGEYSDTGDNFGGIGFSGGDYSDSFLGFGGKFSGGDYSDSVIGAGFGIGKMTGGDYSDSMIGDGESVIGGKNKDREYGDSKYGKGKGNGYPDSLMDGGLGGPSGGKSSKNDYIDSMMGPTHTGKSKKGGGGGGGYPDSLLDGGMGGGGGGGGGKNKSSEYSDSMMGGGGYGGGGKGKSNGYPDSLMDGGMGGGGKNKSSEYSDSMMGGGFKSGGGKNKGGGDTTDSMMGGKSLGTGKNKGGDFSDSSAMKSSAIGGKSKASDMTYSMNMKGTSSFGGKNKGSDLSSSANNKGIGAKNKGKDLGTGTKSKSFGGKKGNDFSDSTMGGKGKGGKYGDSSMGSTYGGGNGKGNDYPDSLMDGGIVSKGGGGGGGGAKNLPPSDYGDDMMGGPYLNGTGKDYDDTMLGSTYGGITGGDYGASMLGSTYEDGTGAEYGTSVVGSSYGGGKDSDFGESVVTEPQYGSKNPKGPKGGGYPDSHIPIAASGKKKNNDYGDSSMMGGGYGGGKGGKGGGYSDSLMDGSLLPGSGGKTKTSGYSESTAETYVIATGKGAKGSNNRYPDSLMDGGMGSGGKSNGGKFGKSKKGGGGYPDSMMDGGMGGGGGGNIKSSEYEDSMVGASYIGGGGKGKGSGYPDSFMDGGLLPGPEGMSKSSEYEDSMVGMSYGASKGNGNGYPDSLMDGGLMPGSGTGGKKKLSEYGDSMLGKSYGGGKGKGKGSGYPDSLMDGGLVPGSGGKKKASDYGDSMMGMSYGGGKGKGSGYPDSLMDGGLIPGPGGKKKPSEYSDSMLGMSYGGGKGNVTGYPDSVMDGGMGIGGGGGGKKKSKEYEDSMLGIPRGGTGKGSGYPDSMLDGGMGGGYPDSVMDGGMGDGYPDSVLDGGMGGGGGGKKKSSEYEDSTIGMSYSGGKGKGSGYPDSFLDGGMGGGGKGKGSGYPDSYLDGGMGGGGGGKGKGSGYPDSYLDGGMGGGGKGKGSGYPDSFMDGGMGGGGGGGKGKGSGYPDSFLDGGMGGGGGKAKGSGYPDSYLDGGMGGGGGKGKGSGYPDSFLDGGMGGGGKGKGSGYPDSYLDGGMGGGGGGGKGKGSGYPDSFLDGGMGGVGGGGGGKNVPSEYGDSMLGPYSGGKGNINGYPDSLLDGGMGGGPMHKSSDYGESMMGDSSFLGGGGDKNMGGGDYSGDSMVGGDYGGGKGKGGLLSPHKSTKRSGTPRPKLEDEIASDIHSMGGMGMDMGLHSDLNSSIMGGKQEYDSDELEKMHSLDRVRSWQRRHDSGHGSPSYSALADAEFSSALDGMITKLHGSKVDWEYRVKLADDLTAALKNVSPQVLLKNLSQIIPLVSNIAAESHFRVALSILNTITCLGDRLRDCKSYLGPKSIQNADLTWLIRRLCTVCGESRSTLRTEGALALSHLIKGAGPELVCEPLYSILSSDSKKSGSGAGRLTAGPRIKAAALDALTFALLTFPRDDFDMVVLAKHACKSLWNTKRRVRQASLECLAVVAHAMGSSISLPMFRQFIEETKLQLSSSSSSSGTMKRGATNYPSVATPSGAIAARVSRHLLPSPSPAGLVEYAVMLPQRSLQQSSYENGKGPNKMGELDPILNGNGSGKNRHSALTGADISWILAGTGPTVNSTFYSPGTNLDWLAEESGNGGWPSEGESTGLKTSDRNYSKSKMKNSHSYHDMLDAPMKPSWSASLSNPNSGHSGAYMDRYGKGSSNGFPPESHNGGGGGGGKGDKGFTLLPNKYPTHSSSNGELPNLSSPYSHHAFGDFNSNLWSQHEEFMGFSNSNTNSSNNNHYKGGGGGGGGGYNSKGNTKHGRLQPMSSDKYSESTNRRYDNFAQNNASSLDQSDSDHDQPFRSSYHQNQINQMTYGSGGDRDSSGHFIKIHRDYDDMDGKKDGGLDSAGSSNTRDSGVSSLKSSKTIPSPPSHVPPYGIDSRPKIPSNKKKSPSPHMQSHPMDNHLSSQSRSWRSTPDVPDLAKNELDLRKSNEIGSDFSRSHSGSSGFLHRKPVLARSTQRKTSTESIQNRLSALELQDFDDGTESELPYSSHKGKIPKPVSYHLSLSTNNLPSEDDTEKSPAPYSTSSLRRNPSNSKPPTKSYLKARTRSRTPVGRGGLGLSSMKGESESITSMGESFTPKVTPKKPAVPKRVYKGSFRESNNSKSSTMATTEVFPADLKPVDSPRHSLSLALNNLNSSEWETNLDGFRLLVRLSRHHPESLRNDLHNININGMRHLMNLRSQVCRSACLFFKELFLSQGKLIEQDMEKISEKLLDKSSDTNKFIREDSGSAIETMVLHLTPAKIITCLDTYGLKHRNPIVRTTAAKMLTLLIRRLGSERILYEHPEKVLPMVMHFLQEGSLETRTHGKAAIAELISNKGFDSQLRRHVAPDVLRNVQKIIATIRTEVFTAHSGLRI